MKTGFLFWLIVLIAGLSVITMLDACPKGYEAHEGVCAAMPQPDYGSSIQPSADVAPNHGGPREAVIPLEAPRASTATVANDYDADRGQR